MGSPKDTLEAAGGLEDSGIEGQSAGEGYIQGWEKLVVLNANHYIDSDSPNAIWGLREGFTGVPVVLVILDHIGIGCLEVVDRKGGRDLWHVVSNNFGLCVSLASVNPKSFFPPGHCKDPAAGDPHFGGAFCDIFCVKDSEAGV